MRPTISRRSVLLLGSAGALQLAAAPAWAGDNLLVIVHPNNALSALNRRQLASLFRVQSTRFPGGDKARPVNLPVGHPARTAFDQTVLGLAPKDVERFWIDSKIRTGSAPPPKMATPASVLQFVSSEPAAIGYVPAVDGLKGVKVVARISGGSVASRADLRAWF